MRPLPALLLALCTACAGPRGPVRGPLAHRSLHPILLLWPDPETRRGTVLNPGRAVLETRVSYTSMFQVRRRGQAEILLDGEWLRVQMKARLGLAGGWELFAALPALYTTSGFLDSLIEAYHDLFHLPQDGRPHYPRQSFGGRLTVAGREAFRLAEDRAGVGDIPVGAAYQLVREGAVAPALLIRGLLELPTGAVRAGFGNGRPDGALGVVAEKTWGRFTLTLGADHAWIRRTAAMRRAGIRLRSLWGGFLAGEVRLGRTFSLLTGLDYQSNPLRRLDLRETRRPQVLLLLGGAADLSRRSRLRFDLVEDLLPDAAPDVTFRLAWEVRL